MMRNDPLVRGVTYSQGETVIHDDDAQFGLLGVTCGLRGPSSKMLPVGEVANVIAFQRWDRHGSGADVVAMTKASHRAFAEQPVSLGPYSAIILSQGGGA